MSIRSGIVSGVASGLQTGLDPSEGGGAPNDPPTAGFTWVQTAGTRTVVFTDTSSDTDGTIEEWAWDFGDGATSALQSPSRTYAAGGSYDVDLEVTDDGAETDLDTQTVTVRGLPTPSVLLNAASTVGGLTQATASASPTAGRLQIAYVASASATAPNIPTCSGQGLTWVEVATVNYVAANRRLTVFRAMGTPSAGALTFDFGVQVQTSVAWGQIEFADVNTGGTNGSGAVVQAPTPTTVGAGVGSINAPTLAALENAHNVNLTISANDINGTMTADADFAEQTDVATTAGNITLHAQTAANQTTCSTTFSGTTSSGGGCISIEIKAA